MPRALPTALRCAAAVSLLGCGDPLATRPVPSVPELRVMLILDPDAEQQPILLQPATGGDTLNGAAATLVSGTGTAASGSIPSERQDRELDECHFRYGSLAGNPRCMTLTASLANGATYALEVTSLGRLTATATTTVPGAFTIVDHEKTGTLPGTVNVRATWTSSAGAFAYLVSITGRQASAGGNPSFTCAPDNVCYDRWFVSTTDTTLAATVDRRYFENAGGPWRLQVIAMNLDAYAYIMTGESSHFFPVPPRQNIANGFGALGAWVIRSVALQ
ncbi:MAG TPA: hypothetical protein VEB19_01480 [Gemmatimonadaceae bacterium]|nr:hypothetical protein [Gemmatimonadaceae bacterium]